MRLWHGIEDIYQTLLGHPLVVLDKSQMSCFLSAIGLALISMFSAVIIIVSIYQPFILYQSPLLVEAKPIDQFYL